MKTKSKLMWLAIVAILLCGGEAWASFPCGIYARIEEVSVGPNADQPTWILIKGDFVVALTSRRYVGPERGYICFSRENADKGRAPATDKRKEKCLIEWGDLKSLVEEKGKGKAYVAFGSVLSEEFDDYPTVRPTAEQAQKNPFPYPIHHGLTRLRVPNPQEADRGGQGDKNPVRMLQEFRTKTDGSSK